MNISDTSLIKETEMQETILLMEYLTDIFSQIKHTFNGENISTFADELNKYITSIDERIKILSDRKQHILNISNDTAKILQLNNVFVKFKIKNVGTIIDNIKFDDIIIDISTNLHELTINLASVDIKNHIVISEKTREIVISTVNSSNQKEILHVKFNLNLKDSNGIINVCSITRMVK